MDNREDNIQMLFELYGNEIFNYVYLTVGNRVDAEDVVQETFLRAVKSWNTFRFESTRRTWLWSITRKCVKDYFRKKRRDHIKYRDDVDMVQIPVNDVSPILNLDLEACMARLPLRQRQVFILKVIHDKSNEEIADMLGWSQVRVRVTMHRAIKTIRELLDR